MSLLIARNLIKIFDLTPAIQLDANKKDQLLWFADDLLISAGANVWEATAILECLSKYASWSGQCLKSSKFVITFTRHTRSKVPLDS